MSTIFKNSKKVINSSNDSITLDSKHKEILSNFRKDHIGTKPELELEKKTLLTKLKDTNISIDDRIAICDKLYNIKIELRKIKKGETDYLLNNSQYIFEYFENKKKYS